jgi:hypothetical protein
MNYLLDGNIETLAPGHTDAWVEVVELRRTQSDGLVLHLVRFRDVLFVKPKLQAFDFLLKAFLILASRELVTRGKHLLL